LHDLGHKGEFGPNRFYLQPPVLIENVSEQLPDGEYQLFANGALVATVRQVRGDWIAAP